jgi:hypothetical protein
MTILPVPPSGRTMPRMGSGAAKPIVLAYEKRLTVPWTWKTLLFAAGFCPLAIINTVRVATAMVKLLSASPAALGGAVFWKKLALDLSTAIIFWLLALSNAGRRYIITREGLEWREFWITSRLIAWKKVSAISVKADRLYLYTERGTVTVKAPRGFFSNHESAIRQLWQDAIMTTPSEVL